MCGIAGVARRAPSGVDPAVLLRMAAALRHRGPDGYGILTGPGIGLAHTRLSIIDPACGAQPLTNQDGRIAITYNGEVFNYPELRAELEAAGHAFRTQSDTEVLVNAYEEWGTAMLGRLNGQFAFAIYDGRDDSLFLARDRFGVRPLFYAAAGGDLWFASEAKALFAGGTVEAAPDLAGLDEVFTFWAARAPRTVFRGVRQLEPGTFAVWRAGALRTARYYGIEYGGAEREPADALDRLDGLLRRDVALQLRADVPVGAYLSGGLDSSITSTLAAAQSPHRLRTFSVTFDDPRLDESAHQRLVADAVHSAHEGRPIRQADIAEVFPAVVWHAETPLVRTAPAPLFLLSRLVREAGIKVVLSGEGADEVFLGYDLFKETSVREFCLRQPGSAIRPRLFDRLYPYIAHEGGGELWRRFFVDAGPVSDPLFSHLPRFTLTARIKDLYAEPVRSALAGTDVLAELRDDLPAAFRGWSLLDRAAYLEMSTLLAGYLLSSQGDRMSLAHAVEGRVPFLDHELFEFAAALPARSKLRGLREKDILRRWAKARLPAQVGERSKQPYRAPDVPAFFHADRPDYVDALLGDEAVGRAGLFDRRAVAGLVRRCRDGRATGFRENQMLVGLLSAQLWHQQYFGDRPSVEPLPLYGADVVLRRTGTGAFSLQGDKGWR